MMHRCHPHEGGGTRLVRRWMPAGAVMARACCLIVLALLMLTGCESIFGKEAGKRGALPGKRADVFAGARALKADAAGVSFIAPEAQEKPDWQAQDSAAQGMAALADKPKEVFSVSTGDAGIGSLIAAPVIAGGKIYTISGAAEVRALSAKNGETLWQKMIPDVRDDHAEMAGSGLAYDGGQLYATTSAGHVIALDASNGKILWTRNLGVPVRAAPLVVKEHLYVTTTSNTLYEINTADGTLGWNHAGIQEATSFLGMAPPVDAGEVIIVPYSSGEIFGLRAFNGRMVWEENLASAKRTGTLPAMADIQGHLVRDGDRLYAASHSGRLVALDIRSGARIFEVDSGSVETPWVAGNAIFTVTTENQLAALSRNDGRVLWTVDLQRYEDSENRADPVIWAGPVLAGGQLWLTNSLGQLKAYDPHNGKAGMVFDVGRPIYLAPFVAGKTLYVLDDKGTLAAYR